MVPSTSSIALEELGWSSFQDLAVAYAEDVYGTPFISFAKGKDGGSDGQQTVFTPEQAGFPRLMVQAKHSSNLQSLTEASFEPDLAKMAALVAEGFGAYLLITNLSVTRQTEMKLRERALAAGFEQFEVHGREQVIARIRSSPRLRALAPRLYGVGDLSLILDERRVEQAKALIAATKSDIDRFVATDAYRASVRALEAVGMVVLLGAPGVGKSTIAKALSIAALDTFRATPFILENLGQITSHWNPQDPARLFWVDDVFGTTQVDPLAADAFNRLGPVLTASLAQGNRFVLTSRTHIWRAVCDGLKRSATPGLEHGIVEIIVDRYSARDRAQIVYNHVKLGDQSKDWRTRFKDLAAQVADHAMFTPEVARRFGLSAFTANLEATGNAINAFVSNPGAYLEEVIAGLSPAGRAGLALIQMSGGAAPMAVIASPEMALVAQAYETSPGQILRELEALDGALCVPTVHNGEAQWTYRHPTIGEAVASVAANSPALLDVYLAVTDVKRILREAVCAGVSVEGAVIQIGASRYDALIERMNVACWTLEPRLVRWFLICKATPEFRRRYIQAPVTRDHRLIGRYGLEGQVLALLAVLRREGLVDPAYLRHVQHRVLEAITQHGVPDCLGSAAQTLVGDEDFEGAVATAIARLRDGGASFMDYWEPSHEDRDQMGPSDAFRGLKEFLEMLDGYGDPDEYAEAEQVMLERISERVDEITAEMEEENWRYQEEEYAWRAQNPAPAKPSAHDARQPSPLARLFEDRPPSPIAKIFSDLDD